MRQLSSHQPYWGKVVLAPCAQHCLPHTHVWTPVSEHCMTTLVTQPWQYTLQPRLLTLCSSVAALVFSSPLRRRDFSCWSLSFSISQEKEYFGQWLWHQGGEVWNNSFQIYIWNATSSSFGKFYIWAFQSSNPTIHLGKFARLKARSLLQPGRILHSNWFTNLDHDYDIIIMFICITSWTDRILTIISGPLKPR